MRVVGVVWCSLEKADFLDSSNKIMPLICVALSLYQLFLLKWRFSFVSDKICDNNISSSRRNIRSSAYFTKWGIGKAKFCLKSPFVCNRKLVDALHLLYT